MNMTMEKSGDGIKMDSIPKNEISKNMKSTLVKDIQDIVISKFSELNNETYMWKITDNHFRLGGFLFVGTMLDASKEAEKLSKLTGRFWYPIDPEKTVRCPQCGQTTGVEVIQALTVCYNCDHVNSEAEENELMEQGLHGDFLPNNV